jgi:hypothetical protein
MFHSCQLWHPPKDRGIFFHMEFMELEHLYVFYTCEKDPQKNDISNLPKGIVVRNKGENRFTTSNFDNLPRADNVFFQYENFVTWSLWCWSHVWKFSRPKDTHKNNNCISTNVPWNCTRYQFQCHPTVHTMT